MAGIYDGSIIERIKTKIQVEKDQFRAAQKRQEMERIELEQIQHKAFTKEKKKQARLTGIKKAQDPGFFKKMAKSLKERKPGKGLSMGTNVGFFQDKGVKRKRPTIFD